MSYAMLLKRNKNSGRYHFRMQVPDDLRPILGWELKRSLGTTNLAEAKKRYPDVLAWAQGQLEAARQAIAERDSEVPTLEDLQDAQEASLTPAWRYYEYRVAQGLPVAPGDEPEEQWKGSFRSTPLAKLLRIDRPDQIDRAVLEVGRAASPAGQPVEQQVVTLGSIFTAWQVERQPPDRTRYEWRRAVDAIAHHLGHETADTLPASAVTKPALVAFKTALLAEGKSGKTVKNRMDVIRALYNHAIDNSLLPEGTANPAKGLKVATKADPASRRLPYSEEDARLILKATRGERLPSRRWLPWLLLWTGARLDELCQLTKADVKQDPEAGWFIDIHHGSPGEGRRLKNLGSARRVPIHDQLIDEGFIDWLEERPDGPIWTDIRPDKFGSRGGTATKKLGQWVRSLGIEDKRKVLHSARHRFKDLCRSAEIARDVHDALTGHTAGDVGSTYGSGHNLVTLRRAVDRLPRVEL